MARDGSLKRRIPFLPIFVAVTRGIPGRTAQVPLDTLPADSIYKKGVDSISAGNIMIAGEAVGAGGTLVGDSLRVTP